MLVDVGATVDCISLDGSLYLRERYYLKILIAVKERTACVHFHFQRSTISVEESPCMADDSPPRIADRCWLRGPIIPMRIT